MEFCVTQAGQTLGVSATQTNPVYRGGATAEGIGGSTAIPQTADIVSGVPMTLDTEDFNPRTDRYLNPAAFAQPTAAFGSSMPTIDGLRGFASLNEDLALSKTIGLQGRSTASDPRGDVQRVQSCGIWEPREQHRQPGNIRENHQPGEHASKHADCVEVDILMRTGLVIAAALASVTIGFAQAPPGNPGGGRGGGGAAQAPSAECSGAGLRIGPGAGVAAAAHCGRDPSRLAGRCVARKLPAGHISRGGPQG